MSTTGEYRSKKQEAYRVDERLNLAAQSHLIFSREVKANTNIPSIAPTPAAVGETIVNK
jgi:hypothetical protein